MTAFRVSTDGLKMYEFCDCQCEWCKRQTAEHPSCRMYECAGEAK